MMQSSTNANHPSALVARAKRKGADGGADANGAFVPSSRKAKTTKKSLTASAEPQPPGYPGPETELQRQGSFVSDSNLGPPFTDVATMTREASIQAIQNLVLQSQQASPHLYGGGSTFPCLPQQQPQTWPANLSMAAALSRGGGGNASNLSLLTSLLSAPSTSTTPYLAPYSLPNLYYQVNDSYRTMPNLVGLLVGQQQHQQPSQDVAFGNSTRLLPSVAPQQSLLLPSQVISPDVIDSVRALLQQASSTNSHTQAQSSFQGPAAATAAVASMPALSAPAASWHHGLSSLALGAAAVASSSSASAEGQQMAPHSNTLSLAPGQSNYQANVEAPPLSDSKTEALLPSLSTSVAQGLACNKQGRPHRLPVCLAVASDTAQLSPYQVWLRFQIEAFCATAHDVAIHTRGRSKTILLGQVGLRCRHCVHATKRSKGASYFPNSVHGFYQASQNMSQVHLNGGICPGLSAAAQAEMMSLLAAQQINKGSKAGRSYWSDSAKQLGLVDTDAGVFCIDDELPPNVRILTKDDASNLYRTSTKHKLLQQQERERGGEK